MANEQDAPGQLTEESSDALSAPSQEEQEEDFSPEDLTPEQREQFDRAAQAVDSFIQNHATYRQTDSNRQAILDYLSAHDLAISPASLELCWEQLKDQLDLAHEQDSKGADEDQPEEQPDASARLTAGLARTKGVESEEDAKEPELPAEPKTARGKKPTAWRNGKEIEVGS